MDAKELSKELEQYKYQLVQVNQALSKDPNNEELTNLQKELMNFVDITSQYLSSLPATQTTASTSSTSTSALKPRPSRPKPEQTTVTFTAGMDCMARDPSSGKFLPAKITTVGGTADAPSYSVVFKSIPTVGGAGGSSSSSGQQTASLLTSNDVKPMTESKKRALQVMEEEAEKERKKKKTEKKLEVRANKAKEQVAKQSNWQNFTKKAAKKGIEIPGMTGESIFKTPDNPYGRVGVVGSGKPMTEYKGKERRSKE
ncbi:hypothetical protein BT69DRAFT_1213406 [Atractiella rhizophila]|nr:hypothetical protein BT69DRAFT_1300019 [Atractiella rhizophila]KAH8928007.1 hypothetical protein BT69DRAFT_1213406 [Atractiella rhizophila]